MNQRFALALGAGLGLAAATAAAHFAWAAESFNSARSNKTQSGAPLASDIVAATGVAIQLTQSGGKFTTGQMTTGGTATFSAVPDGSYAVKISPATTPNGNVGGLSIASPTSVTVTLTCEAASRRDNSYNCSFTLSGGAAVKGGGTATPLTMKLLKP